jgi:hypothetical protein
MGCVDSNSRRKWLRMADMSGEYCVSGRNKVARQSRFELTFLELFAHSTLVFEVVFTASHRSLLDPRRQSRALIAAF